MTGLVFDAVETDSPAIRGIVIYDGYCKGRTGDLFFDDRNARTYFKALVSRGYHDAECTKASMVYRAIVQQDDGVVVLYGWGLRGVRFMVKFYLKGELDYRTQTGEVLSGTWHPVQGRDAQ